MNACLQLSGTVPLLVNMTEDLEYFSRSAATGTMLFELKHALYPGMGITSGCQIKTMAQVQVTATGPQLTLTEFDPNDVFLSITCFADSAPARSQDFRLTDIDPDGHLVKVLDAEVKRIRREGR